MVRSLLAILLLLSGQVRAHGGPPVTHEILFGSGHLDLVTTHGFFSDDTGWMWICEEASGADLAASALRTPKRWLVGTLDGLIYSENGCDWRSDPALEGTYIYALVQDVHNPDLTWAATQDALWKIDGLKESVLETPVDFSLRHLAQRNDGTFLFVGFDGPTPIARIGDNQVELPVQTGRLDILTFDDQGRFYLHAPAGKTDRLIRVSEDGAEVLIEDSDLIRDVTAIGDDLYALMDSGISWSFDDGASWTLPTGEPIRCLVQEDGEFYACPSQGGGPAIFVTSELDPDPINWTWNVALRFNDVTPNTCEPGTTAGNQCPYLWRLAGVELGVLEPADDEPSDTDSAGCMSAGDKTPLSLTVALFALWLGRRKRLRTTH